MDRSRLFRIFKSSVMVAALALCTFATGVAKADPPTVPDVPADAIPAVTLTQFLAPITAIAPKGISILSGVLLIAGILWAIDFAWKRMRRYNR